MSPLQEISIGITRSLWRRCKNRLVQASSYHDMLTYQVRLQDTKTSPFAMLLLYDMYSTKVVCQDDRVRICRLCSGQLPIRDF